MRPADVQWQAAAGVHHDAPHLRITGDALRQFGWDLTEPGQPRPLRWCGDTQPRQCIVCCARLLGDADQRLWRDQDPDARLDPTDRGQLPIYAEMQVPLGSGAHDALLVELVDCAAAVALGFVDWLHDEGALL